MFWFILGVVALILISRALVKKSRGYSNNPSLKNVNDATKSFKSELFKLQFTENAEKYGEKTFQQYEELEKKFNSYLQTLNQKFSAGEITYDRYLMPVQQVQSSLAENFKKLKDVIIFLGNNAGGMKDLLQKPVDTLTVEEKNKIEINKKYLTHFEELYAINQKALTELDQLNLSLSQVVSNQAGDPKQIEYLVKELGVLSERAKKYNIT
jgi:DNA repair ATPase RecN